MIGIDSHIVLIGFMGSGKSTIGQVLSTRLNLPFVDLDIEIERIQGKAISDIFKEDGEDNFRKIEKKVLEKVLASKTISIIATGGGAPCYQDNIELINKSAESVYLIVGVEKLVDRLKSDQSRPLIQEKNDNQLKQFIKDLLVFRRPIYEKSRIRVRGIDDPEIIVARIVKKLMTINL